MVSCKSDSYFVISTCWIEWSLFLIALLGGLLGFLSFLSPKNSIGLYQQVMKWFNWRVEPMNWDREIRNTKWLGLVMIVLSLAIVVILKKVW